MPRKSLLAVLLLAFAAWSCAGPSTPFGAVKEQDPDQASALLREINRRGPDAVDKVLAPKISFFPKRQVLHDSSKIKIRVDDPIGLLRAISQTLTTNVPRKILPDLADTMVRVERQDTYRAVISSPLVSSGFDARGSIQIPNLTRIARLAAALFPDTGTLPDKQYRVAKSTTARATTSGVSGCRAAPTPRPTPRPTPKPTVKPTPTPTPKPAATPTATTAPEPTAAPTAVPTAAPPEPT